jgi:hypothetical protein
MRTFRAHVLMETQKTAMGLCTLINLDNHDSQNLVPEIISVMWMQKGSPRTTRKPKKTTTA